MLPDEYSVEELHRRQALRAAEGYAQLDLYDFAWEEISSLPPQDLGLPEVQEIILALLMRQSRWAEAIAVGKSLCRECPDLPQAYIHTAYCLHEVGRTSEALSTLRSGPNCLQQDGTFHYNCACYLAVLGLTDEARELLRIAFALDDTLRENARTDPDLRTLRGREM